MSEKVIQKNIMLECSRGSSRLFRNNVGAFEDKKTGRWIRFGVGGNGGADLLGWKQIEIGPEHIGMVLAVFAAIEVKRPGEKATDDQERFLRMVERAGGVSGVASSPEEAIEILAC